MRGMAVRCRARLACCSDARRPPPRARARGCARAAAWRCGTASATAARQPIRAASISVHAGLARCGRPTARSARPAATMLLTWSASEIAPTARWSRCRLRCDAVGERRLVHHGRRSAAARADPPDEQSIVSAPAAPAHARSRPRRRGDAARRPASCAGCAPTSAAAAARPRAARRTPRADSAAGWRACRHVRVVAPVVRQMNQQGR